MNRADLRTLVSSNLNDLGMVSSSISELNTSIQDAYDDVASQSRCIIKKSANMNWQANLSYYDFLALGVTDYLGCLAIFNQVSNLFLQDNISLKDLDRIRRDWENWVGTTIMWAPHSLQYIAIAPKVSIGLSLSGQFDLYYYAKASTISDDVTSYLVAQDMGVLLEWYATADCLEGMQEPSKAISYWIRYDKKLEEYRLRCMDLARKDKLLRL